MAKKIESHSTLDRDELKNLARVANDVFFFSTFCYVIHPVRGKTHFYLYPYQKAVLYQFILQRFNIILKFRQAGITELISMYCLWLAMFHDNKKINIISIKDTVAKKVLRKIKYMYKNLPWYMQTPIVNGRPGEFGSASTMEFSNGSLIESIPTSPEAGRSEALTLLVIDEAAMVRWAGQIWAAALPTLSTGGSAIVNSCITGDTEIIGQNGNFRVEQVCPKHFGVQDVRFMNIYVLTHKMRWQKVLYGVNKGNLETWELEDDEGRTIKCTPAHKLLTPNGWMPVKEVIETNTPVIMNNLGINEVEEPQVTTPPEREELRPIKCKDIYLSNLKVLRKFSETIYDITVDVDQSYISAQGYVSHNTPLGMGNFYHSTWVDAMAHANEFNPLRLYWRMHPERDDKWYQTMAKNLGARRTAQEIDGDFLGSGNTVFDLTDIKAIEDCLTDYPPLIKRMNGQYRQYNKPVRDTEYFIGADVSTGRSTDYSSFTCMDKNGEEQVVYKGRIPVDKYAQLLGDTGKLFNYALLAPESNDVGLAVTSKLQTEGYPRLYYYQKMLKKKGKHKPEMDASPGWLTTTKNRTLIIEGLEEDVREENIIIKDPFFVQEAYTFIYDSLGRPVAMGKHRLNTQAADEGDDDLVYADDDIFGKAICNHIRKSKTNIVVQPR